MFQGIRCSPSTICFWKVCQLKSLPHGFLLHPPMTWSIQVCLRKTTECCKLNHSGRESKNAHTRRRILRTWFQRWRGWDFEEHDLLLKAGIPSRWQFWNSSFQSIYYAIYSVPMHLNCVHFSPCTQIPLYICPPNSLVSLVQLTTVSRMLNNQQWESKSKDMAISESSHFVMQSSINQRFGHRKNLWSDLWYIENRLAPGSSISKTQVCMVYLLFWTLNTGCTAERCHTYWSYPPEEHRYILRVKSRWENETEKAQMVKFSVKDIK